MAFTETQKSVFIAGLQAHGWQLRNGVLFSPSGKIDFSEAYFQNWDPEKMRATFIRRAGLIESAALEDWERAANEYRQVSTAAEKALSADATITSTLLNGTEDAAMALLKVFAMFKFTPAQVIKLGSFAHMVEMFGVSKDAVPEGIQYLLENNLLIRDGHDLYLTEAGCAKMRQS